MAEEERPFLARWSERKRQARAVEAPVEDVSAQIEPEPEIDPASLPPIESLGPGSDIAAFLKKGVPEALRRAALRRIWTADPKIRGFREVADYDWDFNAPGYGALVPGDKARKAAERLLARVRRPAAVPKEEAGGEPVAKPVEAAPPTFRLAEEAERLAALPAESETTLSERVPEPEPAPRGRRHGGATPR